MKIEIEFRWTPEEWQRFKKVSRAQRKSPGALIAPRIAERIDESLVAGADRLLERAQTGAKVH